MTYKQAYDKIIDAYFKNEIKPYDQNFCFCGTLVQDKSWFGDTMYLVDKRDHYGYYAYELQKMEHALLIPLKDLVKEFDNDIYLSFDIDIDGEKISTKKFVESHPKYEDALFQGMCTALEVLKQIHIDRGEVIDPLPTFTKRVFSGQIKVKI